MSNSNLRTNPNFEKRLSVQVESSARTLTTIAPQLVTIEEIESVIEGNRAAVDRGYFLPNEDEQVREMFSRYLRTRAALLLVLEDLRPFVLKELESHQPKYPEPFLIAFCTACLLMRSGRFLIDTFRGQKVIWRKLDEAEPRYGIPARQFTHVYKSLTSVRNNLIFSDAVKHYEKHKSDLDALKSNEALEPIVELLHQKIFTLDDSKTLLAQNWLKYRLHSFLRRNRAGFKGVTFELFKLSGSLIAELRMKWKRKRVTPAVQQKIARLLEPGDVIITRHDDAASNLFLPGFWPHGALYIGTQAERRALDTNGKTWDHEQCAPPNSVLEARKDGVLFRPLHDTLGVDACVVLRPKLNSETMLKAISRAMLHQGKRYDFEFDFRRSDKLVCTEVIYRAFHGIGGIEFKLKARAGRLCLSAEDLLDYALEGKYFDVIMVYGANGNRFVTGKPALSTLAKSYRKAPPGKLKQHLNQP